MRNKDTRPKESFRIASELLKAVRFIVDTRKIEAGGKIIVVRDGREVELSYTSYIEEAIKRQTEADLHHNA